MKNRRLFSILLALFVVAVPALAVFTGMDLDATLSNLRRELSHDYTELSQTQERLKAKYEIQHRRMVDIVKKCNDLSLMLYSQKQEYTFDISYALEKVSEEYRDFNKNRTPYDRIVSKLDIEINRYARLIESLRRMPTIEEWTELMGKCEWSWTDNYNGTGVIGRIATSNIEGFKDRSIFLPYAGIWFSDMLRYQEDIGEYWSSSLYAADPVSAWGVAVSSDKVLCGDEGRYKGLSIHPVYVE